MRPASSPRPGGAQPRPLLADPAAAWNHAAFSIAARTGEPAWLAVSTERFRYLEYADARRPVELYDLQADPREWTNLAIRPEHSETLAELKKLAADHRAKYWSQP